MKNFSLFLLNNPLASKMKRGIKSFCSETGSTSTLSQCKASQDVSSVAAPSRTGCGSPLTLEKMILQLELEEEAARKANLDEFSELHRRMSCVNDSDILRSVRNGAVDQYPRFSLDGRDAVIRSSFWNCGIEASRYAGGRRSCCCSSGFRERSGIDGYEVNVERNPVLPPTLAGEGVIWCKPGVVAKLMGLDAVPVPVGGRHGKRRMSRIVTTKQNLRRIGRQELEKERLVTGVHSCKGGAGRERVASCSVSNYGATKQMPVHKWVREDWRFTLASRPS